MKSINNNQIKKTAIITGASKGIGLATARLFAQKGYEVFDFSRSGKSCEYCQHVDCDVTDTESILRARDVVLKERPTIDVVICNAGSGVSGAVEFTSMAEAKKQFDVNFFGAFDTAKAFLTQMRKQGFGNIVFVGSVAGVFAIPFQGFYSASKSAINALASSLRQEVKPFGVKVCVVMPGDTKTEFTQNRQKSTVGEEIYFAMTDSVVKMEEDEQKGKDATCVARAIFKQVSKKHPKLFVTVGGSYKSLVFLNRFLPQTTANDMVGSIYCKKK